MTTKQIYTISALCGYLTKTLSFLKSWAKISPSETVLDVACGTGELERLLLLENRQQKIQA